MSIEKRKTGGRMKYTVRWRDGGAGSRAHRQTFDDEQDALEFQLSLKRTRQTGHRVRPASDTRKTVAEAIAAYENGIGRTKATTTQTQRHDVLSKWVIDQIGDTPLALLDRPELVDWRETILAAGCSPIQANRARSALSAVLTWATERAWIAANPILGWKALSEPPAHSTALSVEEVEHLRLALPADRDRVFLTVMAYAGLRTQEALALAWNHVHPKSLDVVRAYVDGEYKATKTGGSRAVRIPDVLGEDLQALRPGGATPHSHARGGLVFPSTSDPATPLDLHNWRARVWKPALLRAGLPSSIRPYDARHTFASLALHAGITPMELHHQLGHSSWTTTIRHYSHVIQRSGVEDREPMDAAIRRARAAAPKQIEAIKRRREQAHDRLADAITGQ